MQQFADYHYINSNVRALQLNENTNDAIVYDLLKDAQNKTLAKFVYNLTSGTTPDSITFRHNEDANESTLTPGDYLVILNDGSKVVMSEKTFFDSYMKIEIPARMGECFVDYAYIGEDE